MLQQLQPTNPQLTYNHRDNILYYDDLPIATEHNHKVILYDFSTIAIIHSIIVDIVHTLTLHNIPYIVKG